MTPQELAAIRDQHESWLRAQPGVVGTSVGLDRTGQIRLKIFSNHLSPEIRDAIYARLGHVPLAIEETGEILKQSSEKP